MEINWLAIGLATLVPTAVGALWYGPIFGKAWIKSTGKTEEELMEGFNVARVMITNLILGFFIALSIWGLIKGMHRGSDHPAWFGHGALHGAMLGLFLVVPPMVIMAQYDRKSVVNVLLGVGYWVLTCALIGGIVDWL